MRIRIMHCGGYMGILSVKDIAKGMKLAQPVKNFQGHLLLPEGIELSEKHIKLLKTWGIIEVSVDGLEAEKVDKLLLLSREERNAIEKEIAEMYPSPELDPFNAELKRVAVNFLIATCRTPKKRMN
jgi:hypothetical protein